MYTVYIMYMKETESRPGTRVHYDTVTDARAHFSALLDAAEQGVPATVRRDKRRAAVLDADRLLHFLLIVHPARAEVVAEAGGWNTLRALRVLEWWDETS